MQPRLPDAVLLSSPLLRCSWVTSIVFLALHKAEGSVRMAMDVFHSFALLVRSFNSLLPICVESASVLCVIHAVAAVGTIQVLMYR